MGRRVDAAARLFVGTLPLRSGARQIRSRRASTFVKCGEGLLERLAHAVGATSVIHSAASPPRSSKVVISDVKSDALIFFGAKNSKCAAYP